MLTLRKVTFSEIALNALRSLFMAFEVERKLPHEIPQTGFLSTFNIIWALELLRYRESETEIIVLAFLFTLIDVCRS